MSLMDTIKGAREEAAANVRSSDSKDDKSASAGANSRQEGGSNQGFVKRSASRAKPTREAAAGVRVVTSSGKAKSKRGMSKEEQKVERKREREKEDRRYAVSQMLMEENAEYQEHHKIWKRILIFGAVFMGVALLTYMLVSQQGTTAPLWLAIVSMGAMVIAYIAIIIAFVYDWRKIRPIRRQQEARAASMSEKRINRTLRERDK